MSADISYGKSNDLIKEKELQSDVTPYPDVKTNVEIGSGDELKDCGSINCGKLNIKTDSELLDTCDKKEDEDNFSKTDQINLNASPSNTFSSNALMLPCETDESKFEDLSLNEYISGNDDEQENEDLLVPHPSNDPEGVESANENDSKHESGSSSNTETCSEEENVHTETKEDQNNLWNNISSIVNGGLKKNIKRKENSKKTLVTAFTLADGSVINIDEKYWQQPIVLELGNILDAFLKKVRLKAELSKMIYKTDTKDNTMLIKDKLIQDVTNTSKLLEKQNLDMKIQLKQLEEKLRVHDEGAKRTIARLQKGNEFKLNDLTKKCAVAESEKQSSVMNFARREKELLDLRRQKENAEQFAKAAGRDKEKALSQLKQMKIDLSKMRNIHDKRETENFVQTKELERMKEEINSQAIKVRWSQNKLKSEVDSHKETKERCEKMVLEIQQAKEETEQIRKNCQDIIKTYQESEEIKSNALVIEVKEKNEYIGTLKQESTKLNCAIKEKNEKIKQLQEAHDVVLEENQSLKKQFGDLEKQTVKNEHKMLVYDELLIKQKATTTQMNKKMQNIFDLESKVENLNETIGNLNDALHGAVLRRDAALNDVTCKEQKEQELLEFTEKVSSKNTQLTVELEEVTSKLAVQNSEIKNQNEKIASLVASVDELTSTKEKDTQTSLKNQATLNSRLNEKEQTICQLLLQLEELKDEMRTIKRKNAAALKDLTRQLNQVKRKAENAENISGSSISNSVDCGSMGSRTSSVTSLDKIQSYVVDARESTPCEHISVPETTISGPDSLDRQILIERIVRLQQIHAKKNEKIDFLNEHVHQLVAALQKKQRLIQHYIMREESGALASPRERPDQKRHGLTLDLSIEMNQKMQSVLEDTLLKNITLKESLETLGKEVQRLQQQKPSDIT